MNDFMDTVDPRVERAFTKTGRHVHVNMRRYHMWGGCVITCCILIVVCLTIFA